MGTEAAAAFIPPSPYSSLDGMQHFPQSSHLFSRAPNRVSGVRFNLIAQNVAATIIPLLRTVAILKISDGIAPELDFPSLRSHPWAGGLSQSTYY